MGAPTGPRNRTGRRRSALLCGVAAAAILAVACETPPAPPTTAPPRAVRQAPATPDCRPETGGGSSNAADFEPLEGDELGLTAFGAAVEALGGTGRVDITTDVDGRPEFHSVSVDQLGVSLDAEVDPVISVEPSRRVNATAGDPLAPQQWSDELTPYTPTWVCGRGTGVDIAVVDTGVDRTHPDLAGRTTTGGSSLGSAAQVTEGSGGVDPHGHGTHVAGIAAATADNGIGIRGVAPEARIMPLRVLDSSGSGWNADVAAGITWAVDHGAEVINLSLGNTQQSQAVTNAITYADAAGVVVVAAAGNGGAGALPHYPAADNRTVAVASVDPDGSLSDFSTTGSYVDVAAPGRSILSTVPGGGYSYMSGTSMAAPFASGVAALLIANRGSISPEQVLQRFTSTATDAGPAGSDDGYGHGIIDPVAVLSS